MKLTHTFTTLLLVSALMTGCASPSDGPVARGASTGAGVGLGLGILTGDAGYIVDGAVIGAGVGALDSALETNRIKAEAKSKN